MMPNYSESKTHATPLLARKQVAGGHSYRKLLLGTALAIAGVSFHGQAAMAQAASCDPYKDYSCFDSYLGEGFFERLANYYALEWEQPGPPADPNAPPGRRDGWPATPETTPPMAYTEFPTGAVTSIGVTRPGSVDSPLMVALANTGFGQWLNNNDFQIYGWLNPGMNISSNSVKFGNAPVAYTVMPNSAELDQAVLYLDRFPDTVETDHVDWGMRLSVLYGQNYRYTNSYGIASYQFNHDNGYNGYDFPMVYGELWIPQVAEGLMIRVGRYISIPDIEAQLAPNNIMFTHSMTYAWDNYTNTGIVASLQFTKNFMLQAGVTDGTETPLWHNGVSIANQFVTSKSTAATAAFVPGSTLKAGQDPLYPNASMLLDPGNQPSLTLCGRWESSDGNNVFYPCLDGINKGNWGYNNIQWHGFTFYHKFNDQWHIDFESYYLSENNVPNLNNAEAMAIYNNGGTPFSPQYVPFNSPNLASCAPHDANKLSCSVQAYGVISYINYSPEPLDNFSLRPEFYDDPEGWRTGTGGPTKYAELTLGWQHWFSPQVEIRPEISYWQSFRTAAFNNDVYNPDTATTGPAAPKKEMEEFAMDAILHF